MIRASLILLALAAGCNPTLSAQSMAPPGRAARLDAIDSFWGIKGYRLALSKGVAIAVTCNHGGPCGKLRVTSDDPSIAEVHNASLGVLQPSHGGVYAPDNHATAAAFVVVGKAPGTTKVRVRTNDGGRTIDVTIVPAPTVTPQAVVAR